jgi:hypothetical protein
MGPIEKELSVLRTIDTEFQRDVLDKLGRLETRWTAWSATASPGA